ncbi:glutamine-hydrolyzing carbamoyl-phosphate synthase small subunit [Nakamurella sp. PAMC28650]|uniref:glutamine-hydrolyzing carbamoyl-phosphate synthase small subunit n=1 Tax=Nakamurella sp. PAMC28650 TaxID=2762325 RepID=UPI00164EB1A6|nr:glutamine-hydrolyzing carbamoyl-phosphate synthase small subunit [Nakamurella sp. PAMC28650]QNK80852.1 glutamine-hydrolyzing carbamoyl-phosphate synthase small subunit [Nakamurella sp. PAMC28650]
MSTAGNSSTARPEAAALVLADGRVFRGTAFGATGIAFGEAVFTTGMTGYQETLTDPSYRRQVVVSTAPQIGNTGWVSAGGPDGTQDDNESGRIWVAGYVIRDLSPAPSNWRASSSLPQEMEDQGVPGISGVDTRALTRHLRTAGAMNCGIFSGAGLGSTDEMLAQVRAQPQMAGADLTSEVSTRDRYTVPSVGETRYTVAAIDLGIKANTPRMMAERGITTHVVPADVTIDDIQALGVDGVFLSNGPGDPSSQTRMVALTREILSRRIPLFGICFGNQILGRALGFGTYKLKFGHRGINQPVLEKATGRVLISAHNHGFAVDAPLDVVSETEFGRVQVGFVCLNDNVVEGLECLDVPAFSVQFHPEAAAGPHDAQSLFDRFTLLMAAGSKHASTTAKGLDH